MAPSRVLKTRLGSLVAPTEQRTQSEGETLDLLLATHFPDSGAVEGGVVPPRHMCGLAGSCKDHYLS